MYVLFEFIKPNIHSLIIHTKVFQSISVDTRTPIC